MDPWASSDRLKGFSHNISANVWRAQKKPNDDCGLRARARKIRNCGNTIADGLRAVNGQSKGGERR